jgi:hypothetical protein
MFSKRLGSMVILCGTHCATHTVWRTVYIVKCFFEFFVDVGVLGPRMAKYRRRHAGGGGWREVREKMTIGCVAFVDEENLRRYATDTDRRRHQVGRSPHP